MDTEKFADFVKSQNWIVAKTYEATAPHKYLVKDKLSEDDQKVFPQIVSFIRENGVKEKFYSKTFVYFYFEDHKYWTMGAPIYQTTILNRAKV